MKKNIVKRETDGVRYCGVIRAVCESRDTHTCNDVKGIQSDTYHSPHLEQFGSEIILWIDKGACIKHSPLTKK